jgi:UDP-N-acetylmuramyl pentapeptide synthase
MHSHSKFSFSIFSANSRIVVLDLTHAGIIIAEKLAEIGLDVSAVDVYGTVDDDTLSMLRSDHGIKCYRLAQSVNDFDYIISPVHLDPEYDMLVWARESAKTIISHHQIVGMLLIHSKKLEGMKVIEITGSKAKTSSASLLADMLSRKMSVLLHTSRGLEIWKDGMAENICAGLSIAPGSILLAFDAFKSNAVNVDCCIFEVSIGGTGIGDIGIITTLEPDYAIAKSSYLASDAKLQMIEYRKDDGLIILNARDGKAIKKAEELGRNVFTFSDSDDFSADIQILFDGRNVSFVSEGSAVRSTVNPLYNAYSYTTAFAASVAAALNMGVDLQTISHVISGFIGLAGRMQEKELEGRLLVDNSNSGMDIRSVGRSLDYGMSKNAGKVIMVLGEEAEQVCEGLLPEDVLEFVNRRMSDIDELILVGDRMKYLFPKVAKLSSSLDSGLKQALVLSSKGDLILSCVKCFR